MARQTLTFGKTQRVTSRHTENYVKTQRITSRHTEFRQGIESYGNTQRVTATHREFRLRHTDSYGNTVVFCVFIEVRPLITY